jgi:hypothetical protein
MEGRECNFHYLFLLKFINIFINISLRKLFPNVIFPHLGERSIKERSLKRILHYKQNLAGK